MRRTIEQVREFAAADQGLAFVSFARADRTVHSTLINAGVMTHPVTGEEVVAFVVRGDTVKLRYWRQTPQATITFRAGWSWIGVEGSVTQVGPDDPMDGFDPADLPRLLKDIFTAAGGTHNDWEEYDRVMAAERRAGVFIHPTKVRGTNLGR
ncbi:MAG: pyridoxamine 5'-phosphate oxidase [bacterium]|nr:pyridoxamine 5'-phosphate oxidase [bacterium]